MPGVAQVVIVVAVVVIGVVLWFALEWLEEQPRRPGYVDRSPDGSDKPRWRVRPR